MNPRNTAAGSAGAGGYNFQAAAIAVSCAHLLAFRPLNWAPGVSSAPRTVEAETGGPGDDLRIVCEDGTAVEVQVKKGLTRGARLWDALLGLARGLAADPSLHGVLLVDSSSSRPVKEHLRQDVPRVAHGRTDGLREITRELVERLEESGVTDLTVLRRLTIAEKNLYPGADGHDGAIALLGNVVDDPKAAWEALEREAHAMMEGRARRDADALRRLVGVPAPAARQRPPRGIRLVKPADDLRPEDLRFQVLKSGEEADPRYRPFYPIYVPRMATVEPDSKDPAESYDEEGLARKLRSGEGFVLLGQPLDGKSRTIYEVLKRLGDRLVVVPARSGGVIPAAEDLEALVGGREVVLLLEDLNDYVASGFPLRDLAEELDRHAAGCVVAATCRDGPEMSTITAAQGTDSGRFYEESLPSKLTLQPLDADEKGRLAVGVRKEWDPSDAQMYPTPGTIVMADALRAMRRRFDTLTNEQRDALRAMQLMAIGGVLPFTHERLRAVLAHPVLFDRPGLQTDSINPLAMRAAPMSGNRRWISSV